MYKKKGWKVKKGQLWCSLTDRDKFRGDLKVEKVIRMSKKGVLTQYAEMHNIKTGKITYIRCDRLNLDIGRYVCFS